MKGEYCQAFELAETDVMLSNELQRETEQFAVPAPDQRVDVDDPDVDHGSEADEKEEPAMKKHKGDSDAIVKTLRDVLSRSGFLDFVPPENDDESKALERVKAMGPHLRMFASLARCSEGILSKAAVLGHRQHPREQWIHEKELAAARAQYHCSAQRQSRHSLWMQFSERVMEVVGQMKEDGDVDAAQGATQCKIITPNSFFGQDGERTCQLLVVRPFKAGGHAGALRFCVVIAAWRGGKSGKTKSAKQYPWTEGSLPKYAATWVHVRMLKPEEKQNENGWELLTANNLSAVFALDPADEGSIVMEVPPSCFEYAYEPDILKVWVSKASIRALGKVAQASVPFHNKKKDDELSKSYYTECDFARSAAGFKNMSRYLWQMRKDFETHFHHFVKESGEVKLRKDLKVSWDELVARLPSYFRRYVRGSDHFKKMSKEQQKLTCLGFYGHKKS